MYFNSCIDGIEKFSNLEEDSMWERCLAVNPLQKRLAKSCVPLAPSKDSLSEFTNVQVSCPPVLEELLDQPDPLPVTQSFLVGFSFRNSAEFRFSFPFDDGRFRIPGKEGFRFRPLFREGIPGGRNHVESVLQAIPPL